MRTLFDRYIGLVALLAVFGIIGLGVILTSDFHMDKAPIQTVPSGDATSGHELIRDYGCGSCHSIPGVAGANGNVGPRLDGIGARAFLAGRLSNTPENLIFWIQFPQHVDPNTAMPEMDIPPAAAADIAAYLYTLN